jgi:type IV secretion system protein VirB10
VSLFRRGSGKDETVAPSDQAPTSSTEDSNALDEAAGSVAGDRGIPSINRGRSIQSRVSSLLAIALMSLLGLGFLTWYYAKVLSQPRQAQHAAQASSKTKAQSEMALPPLGALHPPRLAADSADASGGQSDTGPAGALLGPAPGLPTPAASSLAAGVASQGEAMAPKSPGQIAFERRLAGPAFAKVSAEGTLSAPTGNPPTFDVNTLVPARPPGSSATAGENTSRSLEGLLRPTVTPAVEASVVPTRRFLLAKGSFLDCTLETAIDSTLPGMTTCITATDTFSADGTVVLLERGTKLVGETRGQVQQGAARIFVLWSEARTPTGVVVPLSSPGTDELGRSGLPGDVNRHFWDRFGAAILLTVVNGTVQAAANSQNRGNSVVVSPSTSTDVMTEILRSTVDIPPTVTKQQGDRIQVFVARDVDFRPVYALRVANTAKLQGAAP